MFGLPLGRTKQSCFFTLEVGRHPLHGACPSPNTLRFVARVSQVRFLVAEVALLFYFVALAPAQIAVSLLQRAAAAAVLFSRMAWQVKFMCLLHGLFVGAVNFMAPTRSKSGR